MILNISLYMYIKNHNEGKGYLISQHNSLDRIQPQRACGRYYHDGTQWYCEKIGRILNGFILSSYAIQKYKGY